MNAICARPPRCLGRPALHLGDQVAEGRLATAVLGRAVGELGPVERPADLAELDRAPSTSAVGDGGVDDAASAASAG